VNEKKAQHHYTREINHDGHLKTHTHPQSRRLTHTKHHHLKTVGKKLSYITANHNCQKCSAQEPSEKPENLYKIVTQPIAPLKHLKKRRS
jgi:hypothetical protein